MNARQVLDLIGDLPASEIRMVFAACRPMPGSSLRRGLYLGRNGGMPAPGKWFARNVIGRDWFAKLVLDGWGVNVRCRQDGSHALRTSEEVPGGVVVDMPFRLTDRGLDYGFHVLGRDIPGALQFRDLLGAVSFAALTDVVPESHLARVGARRGEPCDEGELIIGYMAPLGLEGVTVAPFGMVWNHEPTQGEVASAEAYRSRFRIFDSG